MAGGRAGVVDEAFGAVDLVDMGKGVSGDEGRVLGVPGLFVSSCIRDIVVEQVD